MPQEPCGQKTRSREKIALLARDPPGVGSESQGEGEGQVRGNADLGRKFTYRLLDSVKYIRKTNDYKVLRSRLELTMSGDGESESAPDGESHMHEIMYGREWERSQVVVVPRVVRRRNESRGEERGMLPNPSCWNMQNTVYAIISAYNTTEGGLGDHSMSLRFSESDNHTEVSQRVR